MVSPLAKKAKVPPSPNRQATLMHLLLLDGFELRSPEGVIELPFSSQRLISLLALHNRALRRLYIAGLLWPDATDARATANLRSTLWRLRRAPYRLVDSSATSLRLAREVIVDTVALEDRATKLIQGTVAIDGDDIHRIARVGDLLPDRYDDWLEIERERIRQLRLHALEAICLQLTADRMFGLAIEAGLAVVAGEPLRESAHRCLIQAYLAEGNIGAAIRQFETYRDLMCTELNIDPSTEMKELLAGPLHLRSSTPTTAIRAPHSKARANATITLP
jgi:DNA-binding SARP family transcriptional activator